MPHKEGHGGYQADTKSASSRRADFDLHRRLARLEHDSGTTPSPDPDPVLQWNSAWGGRRMLKASDQGGFSTTEAVISGFSGFVPTTVDGRVTSISYGLTIPAITNPPGESWLYVRLRLGTTTGGTMLDTHIYPFRNGQQNFGNGVVALQGEFTLSGFAAGAAATLTFQTGTGITAATIGINSWIVIQDAGPGVGAVPIPTPTPAWIPVTFQNSWANSGGSSQPAQYRKVGDTVEVRLACGQGTSGSVAFTLPVGYRPPNALRRPMDGAGAYAFATVNGDGTVQLTGVASIQGGFSFSVTP